MFENAQQKTDQTKSDALRADPDVQRALRGDYGTWAPGAARLPAAWSAATRNQVMAQTIAQAKGLDTSGLDATDNFATTDHGVPLVVQAAPYVIGGIAGAGAVSAGLSAGAGAAGAGGVGIGETGAAVGLGGAKVGATMAGLSYADLLKTGLSVGGQLINGAIQSNAAGTASAGQLALQQQALDYEKANDLYNRGLAATALDYSKANDRTDRGLAATALATANQRYGDYQGRIAPFIATGRSSNDRMAALLGLPAGSGSSGGPSGGATSDASDSQGVPLTPDILAKLRENYGTLGTTPTGEGSGPTDIAYYGKQVAATGGLTEANNHYWFGPDGRIAHDMTEAGTVRGAPITTAASPSPTGLPTSAQPSAPTSAPIAPSPAAPPASSAGGTVQMRGPDGSVKAVNQADVAHYQQLGATVIGAAA